MRFLFRFVLITLRHYGHLALSSCLTLRAKLVFLVELKACVPKLCVLLYSVLLSCVTACLVCHCNKLRSVNLISIKAIIIIIIIIIKLSVSGFGQNPYRQILPGLG